MIEQFVLEENGGKLVVVFDNLFGLRELEDGLVALEDLHGLLDTSVELPRPQNFAGGWRQIAGNRGLQATLLVDARNGFNVPGIGVQELDVFVV